MPKNLKPLDLSDDDLDRLAGFDPATGEFVGFSEQELLAARQWGTEKLQDINAAQPVEEEEE